MLHLCMAGGGRLLEFRLDPDLCKKHVLEAVKEVMKREKDLLLAMSNWGNLLYATGDIAVFEKAVVIKLCGEGHAALLLEHIHEYALREALRNLCRCVG